MTPGFKLVGYAFTCKTMDPQAKVPTFDQPQLFSWVKREDAEKNHAAVLNDVRTFREVSDVFQVFKKV